MADEVTPLFKESQNKSMPPTPKKAPAAKKPAKKAPAAKKAAAPKPKSESGIVRAKSTVPTEGTQKDEFTGEVLPMKAFPTVRQADGSYVRGTVARKNLADYRADKKAKREAAKAEAASKKAAAAKKAPAAKKAAAK